MQTFPAALCALRSVCTPSCTNQKLSTASGGSDFVQFRVIDWSWFLFNKQLGQPTTLYIANREITHQEAIDAGCDPVHGPYDGARLDTIVEIDMNGNIEPRRK